MDEALKETKPRFLLAVPSLLAFLLFFWATFHSDLSKKEAREGVPIVFMNQGESFWLPKINEYHIRTKPPLFYWSGLAVSKIFGEVNELAVRLPSVLAGAGTVLLTTILGTWLFSLSTGFLAGLILTTFWRFAYLGSHARIDMLFAFFITAAFLAFWKMLSSSSRTRRNTASWLAALFLGLALLTKGPLGLVFPLLALFIYQRWFRPDPVPWARLVLVPLGMALMWVVPALLEGGADFQNMIVRETWGRMTETTSIQIHKEPFYFYIPQIFLGLAPWSLFLPVAAWQGFKNHRGEFPWLFPALGFTTLLVFLSFFSGKRGDYLLPLYPMGAILIAHFFSSAASRKLSPGMTLPAGLIAGSIGVLGVVLVLPVLIPDLNPEQWTLLAERDRHTIALFLENHLPSNAVLFGLTATMFLFAAGLFGGLRKKSKMGVCYAMAVWSFFFLFLIHGPVAQVVNRYNSLKPFAEQVTRLVGQQPLFYYGEPKEDLFYYIDRPFQELRGNEVIPRLRGTPGAYLLVLESISAPLLAKAPDFKILMQSRNLHKRYQLIGKPASH